MERNTNIYAGDNASDVSVGFCFDLKLIEACNARSGDALTEKIAGELTKQSDIAQKTDMIRLPGHVLSGIVGVKPLPASPGSDARTGPLADRSEAHRPGWFRQIP